MSTDGLASDTLKQEYAAVTPQSRTFKPQGINEQAALDYLKTDEGALYYWRVARAAEPGLRPDQVADRAIGQLMSGRELPRMETIEPGEPLLKFVAEGSHPTPYSPYWMREPQAKAVSAEARNISDYFALPVSSEAPRYGMYRMTAKVPTQIFISTVAPTSELGGLVTKGGGAEQALVPNRQLFTDPVYVKTVDNIPRIAADLERGAKLPGVVRGAAVLGAAVVAYDATTTASRTSDLLQQENRTGAQSEVLHFGGRTLSMLGGVALGAKLGAALGWETGPGVLVATTVGGLAGAVVGEKVATALDNRRIYTQQDDNGDSWTMDPQQPARGWTRTMESTHTDVSPGDYQLRSFAHRSRTINADPVLADQLNYQASSVAVEMALAHAPLPQDAYALPANGEDAPSIRNNPWIRSAQTHGWSRVVATGALEHGMVNQHMEYAGPQRAAELDRTAEAVLAHNAMQTPHAIASRYQTAYEQFGWDQFGPLPEAVTYKLRQSATQQRDPEGNEYTRNAKGQWTTPHWYGDHTAQGNLKDQLDDAWQRQSAPVHLLTQAQVGVPHTAVEPITSHSSNREMFDALCAAAQSKDVDAMRAVGQAYLQSERGQAWLEQGHLLNQQQTVAAQQASLDTQQQAQALPELIR